MLYNGLIASLFLETVRPGSFIGVIAATKIGTILPLLVFAVTIFQKTENDNRMVLSHSNTKWLVFFMFLLLIQVPMAEVTLYSYNVFTDVLQFMVWYYVLSRLLTDLDKVKGYFMVMVVSHIAILIMNPEVILNPDSRSYLTGNPFMGDGNDFSLSVCIVIPMCIYLLQQTRKKYMKMAYGLMLATLIMAVIGTQSRGGSLAIAGVFLYLWWYGRQKIMGVMLVLMGIVVLLLYAPPIYFERMNSIKNYENEGSALSRIIAWKTAIRMATTYPITGVGSGHFAVSIGNEFRPRELNAGSTYMNAHSMYFLILGELGFPGIIFFLSVILTNYARNQRNLRRARGSPDDESKNFAGLFIYMNAGFIGFCIAGAFLSVTYFPHLYMLAGLFTATQFVYRRHLEALKLDTTIPSVVQYEGEGEDEAHVSTKLS